MLTFPKYESYQDTGEDWLGEIPQHWQLLRTKNIFRLVAEPAPKNNDEELLSVYSDIGVKPRRELEERGNKASTTDGYWFVKKGDVIVNKLLAWMGAIGVSDYDGVTSPAYDILRAYKPIDSKFYHYLFRNPICISKLKQYSKGIMEMRLRLYFDEFGNIKIPYPPIEDQQRIVEFLDRKTSEIDQAIAQKQQLIELLQEQKAILINQAVTKGLNSNVSMHHSGIDWIGEVPIHWKVSRLKFVCRLETGHTPRRSTDRYWIPEKCTISWVSLNDTKVLANADYISKTTYQISPKGMANSSAHLIEEGAVVFTRDATIGLAAITTKPMAVSQHIIAWVCPPEIDNFYLLHVIYSMREELDRLTMGSTLKTIGMTDVKKLTIPVPPLEEQIEISKHIKLQKLKLEKAIGTVKQQIEKLQEYRQILIAAAVTGKIKV